MLTLGSTLPPDVQRLARTAANKLRSARGVPLRGYRPVPLHHAAWTRTRRSERKLYHAASAAVSLTAAEWGGFAVYLDERARDTDRQWSIVADRAARETFGRPYQFTDYQIAGIARTEFADRYKGRLRKLAHAASRDRALAHICRHVARYYATKIGR